MPQFNSSSAAAPASLSVPAAAATCASAAPQFQRRLRRKRYRVQVDRRRVGTWNLNSMDRSSPDRPGDRPPGTRSTYVAHPAHAPPLPPDAVMLPVSMMALQSRADWPDGSGRSSNDNRARSARSLEGYRAFTRPLRPELEACNIASDLIW